MDSSEYDLFILDTAPTGHTLRLLTLPELLDNWIKFLANLRWKYHYMVDRLSRNKIKKTEQADEFLLEMKRTVMKVQKLLRNPDKTSFVVVTIPEDMAVEETKDLIKDLIKSKIPVKHIVINNIVPEDDSLFLKARRKIQKKYINKIRKFFSGLTITEIQMEPDEIRGKDKLNTLGGKLFRI